MWEKGYWNFIGKWIVWPRNANNVELPIESPGKLLVFIDRACLGCALNFRTEECCCETRLILRRNIFSEKKSWTKRISFVIWVVTSYVLYLASFMSFIYQQKHKVHHLQEASSSWQRTAKYKSGSRNEILEFSVEILWSLDQHLVISPMKLFVYTDNSRSL